MSEYDDLMEGLREAIDHVRAELGYAPQELVDRMFPYWEDEMDLMDLEAALREGGPKTPLEEVLRELGLSDEPRHGPNDLRCGSFLWVEDWVKDGTSSGGDR